MAFKDPDPEFALLSNENEEKDACGVMPIFSD